MQWEVGETIFGASSHTPLPLNGLLSPHLRAQDLFLASHLSPGNTQCPDLYFKNLFFFFFNTQHRYMCDNGSGLINKPKQCFQIASVSMKSIKWVLQPVFLKNIRRLEHNRGKKISECIIVLSKAKS